MRNLTPLLNVDEFTLRDPDGYELAFVSPV